MPAPSSTQRAAAFHELDWRDDAALAAFAEEAWRQRPRQQVQAEQLAELTAAWMDGEQYLLLAEKGDDACLELATGQADRLRVVFNMLGPYAEQWIARASLDNLDAEVTPVTPSGPDLDASRQATAVARYYRDKLNLPGIKDDFVRALFCQGTSFLKVTWDPTAGSEFPLTPAELKRWLKGDLIQRLELDPERDVRLNAGEPVVERVRLDNLTWGPRGVEFQDAEWVLEARERSASYVMARWGLSKDQITAAYGTSERRWYRGGYDSNGSIYDGGENRDRVCTYELWVPRGPLHPRGRHAVLLNDRVLNRKGNRELANPYRHGTVPYIGRKCVTRDGSPLGTTPAWQMFGPQAMLNRMAGIMMEGAERCANPTLWARENEVIDEWALNNRPGGLHRYKNEVPQWLQGAEFPSSLYAWFDRIGRVLQDIIGVHDPSMGKAPAQGRSGRYVMALTDADNTRMSPTLRTINSGLADAIRLLLCAVQQFQTEKRTILIRGADNRWERRAFAGKELAPGAESSGPEAFNVEIHTSGQARSRAAQIELVTMLIQFGFYDAKNPDHQREVRRILEIGDTTGRIDPDQVERDATRRVIELLLVGRRSKPQRWQALAVRRDELQQFQRQYGEQLSGEQAAVLQRYEREILSLQATQELYIGQIGDAAKRAFLAQQQAWQQMGGLEATATPGEQPAIGRFLASPRAALLQNFLAAGGGASPQGGPPAVPPQIPMPGPMAPAAA